MELWTDRNDFNKIINSGDIDKLIKCIINTNKDIKLLKEHLTKLELVSCPLYVDPKNSCQDSIDRLKYLNRSNT